MCISISCRVIAVDGYQAELEALGVPRRASTVLHPDVHVGDYVLTSLGMIVDVLDEEEAQVSLALFRELLTLLPDEEGTA